MSHITNGRVNSISANSSSRPNGHFATPGTAPTHAHAPVDQPLPTRPDWLDAYDPALVRELEQHVLVTRWDRILGLVDQVYNWGRRSSLWPLGFGLACCAIEMICTASSRYDMARFGAEVFRGSPRQADLMIVSGTVTKTMMPLIARLYDQMAEPKYVMAMGACATGGGPFKEGYNVVSGVDKFLPVDVYVPGCPPTPQALLDGLMTLQRAIDGESIRQAPWYRKDVQRDVPVPALGPDLIDLRTLEVTAERAAQGLSEQRETELDKPGLIDAPRSTLDPDADPTSPSTDAKVESPSKKATSRKPKRAEVRPSIHWIGESALHDLATTLNGRFGPDAVSISDNALLVAPEHLVDVAEALKRSEVDPFDYLVSLQATHYADAIEVTYHLESLARPGSLLVLRCRADEAEGAGVLPSVTPIWPGAEFQEREVFDLFGVQFDGHPDLRRILMWDGFAYHPMRRDYLEPYYEGPTKALASRVDDGRHYRVEERNPFGTNLKVPRDFQGWDNLRGEADPKDAPMDHTQVDIQELDADQFLLSMGPQHPSTHGVFRMNLRVDGETVTALKPILGYMHRNHEKIGERNTYLMNFPFTDRLDYLTSMGNNLGYALAVEQLLGEASRPPERAEYLRVIMAELTRISSHLWSIGFLLNDLGAFFTPALYAIEERELILDLFEWVAGSRMMCNYMRFGGVAFDLPAGWAERCGRLVRDRLPRKIDELDDLLSGNEIVRDRCVGMGVLDRPQAIALSTAGPVLRASGVAYDLRRDAPYSIYERFDFDVVTAEHGDIYDRYWVRLQEIRQSLRILEQALADLPEGPILAGKKQYKMNVPAGEAYSRIENPKGELGYYLVSDGSGTPYRYHVRSPSFINLQALEPMCLGQKVADVVAVLGSLDIVLGEVDR